ncbi:hypothetical protein [Dyadobacter luticola]|uniref:Lipocalin-like domain-containing protein n=1 Tax=Dyadobacter luticola TaxID=1979387 RepID=A0A5R9L1Y9_9BACT|nr:hypothetical protein [Dyadobacter luticola]TLV02582.1 hypothetical protein FEN17_02880 [Dyadobacter luticola]
MSRKIAFLGPFMFSFVLLLQSCGGSAGNPEEASQLLTASPKWAIDEITVNDAVTFKDGKMTKQFGGIDFERYMETVELKKDGTFSGVFKGDPKPFEMKWKVNGENITVGLEGRARGSDWTIAPRDVTKDAFIMRTKSTAYDYPRETSISLKFKALK